MKTGWKVKLKALLKPVKILYMTSVKTIQYISDHFAVSPQQAEEEVKKYWQQKLSGYKNRTCTAAEKAFRCGFCAFNLKKT